MDKIILQEKLYGLRRQYGQRLKIALLLGGTGEGKTKAIESLRRSIMRMYPHFRLDLVNLASVEAARAYAQHNEAVRTKNHECFQVQIDNGDVIVFIALAAEEAFIRGEANVPELLAWLDELQVDLIGLCVNPFIHDSELGGYSFAELTWYQQHHFGFTFEQSSHLAAELLWGVTPLGLVSLNCEWDQLTSEQKRSIRLKRQPAAKFGQPLKQAFDVEGDANGDSIMRLMQRVAETVSADDLSLGIVREIVKRRPQQVIVAGTFQDILSFLPGVGNEEFLRLCRSLFVQPSIVRMNQIVAHSSMNFVLRDHVTKPVFKEGVNTDARELVNGMLDQLRTRPRHSLRIQVSRWVWATATIPLLIAVCITPRYSLLLATCVLTGMLTYCVIWVWTQRRRWWQRSWKKPVAKPVTAAASTPAIASPAPSLKPPMINRLAENNHVLQASKG